jgi:hypothetical protein
MNECKGELREIDKNKVKKNPRAAKTNKEERKLITKGEIEKENN